MSANIETAAATPRPVMGLYDRGFWDSVRERRMALQKCAHCGAFRYPPGPTCPECLSTEYAWTPVAGGGEIMSWTVFHRGYLPAYPPPYNVMVVRLDEGPFMVSNLTGSEPNGHSIGQRVRLCYETMPDGAILPRFELEGGQ